MIGRLFSSSKCFYFQQPVLSWKNNNPVCSKILRTVIKCYGYVQTSFSNQIPFWLQFSGMLNRTTSTFDNLYVSLLDKLIEVVSKWGSYVHYVEKLTKLRSHLTEKGKRSFDAKSNQFNTLIHGDIWVNNTMYSYNAKNEPEKMMLVDFQFCCWTSPTIDLHYFLNTSLEDELRLNHQEELLQFYHSELSRMLTSLQYKKHIPTLDEFHVQFMENSFYGRSNFLAMSKKIWLEI